MWFRQFRESNYRVRVDELVPVIGTDAARVAVLSDKRTALGGLCMLPALPLFVWAELGPVWQAAMVGGVCMVIGVAIAATGIRMSRQSVAAANQYVGAKLGYRVQLSPGGRKVSQWNRAIAEELARHTKEST